MFLVLIGFFGMTFKVEAQGAGTCVYKEDGAFHKKGDVIAYVPGHSNTPQQQCGLNADAEWIPAGSATPSAPITAYDKCISDGGTPAGCQSLSGAPISADNQTALERLIGDNCGLTGFSVQGCIIRIVYVLFYTLPSFLLWFAAIFFNALIAIALSTKLYATSTFIPEAWAIVRDLSNIFFILILLYVAIQMILGLGGHGSKKIIVQVVIMALLINFSMFFTKVVIDSSNILALVFYNKMNTETTVNGRPRPYNQVSSNPGERDLSGKMVEAFDPTKLLTPEFFEKAKTSMSIDGRVDTDPVPFGILFGMIIITGLIMGFAAYAFFVSGFAFLSRLIELWILIIFSPFALMSSTLPILAGVPYAGWKQWLDKLFKISFMAPIFMFFIYLIFRLVDANIFGNFVTENGSMMSTILLVVLPAMMILIMLIMATKYAKKASGQLGEVISGTAKMLGGLAIGAASGGVALAGRASLGAFMKGASTGDTANQRFAAGAPMRGKWDTFKGAVGHYGTFGGLTKAQVEVGKKLNADQHNIEHAAHARHDLDTTANSITHGRKKKWEELNGEERYQARRQIARDKAVRDNSGSVGMALGSRKWDALSTAERAAIDRLADVGNDPLTNKPIPGLALDTQSTAADGLIKDAYRKQGIISNMVQSTVTGTYDVRKLADIIAKEQTTGITKLTSGLTGAIAKGMRGGFKAAGVNYGTPKGDFLKDLGNTISESLKSVKINVDLSGVAEVKKEDGHGGGGGHH